MKKLPMVHNSMLKMAKTACIAAVFSVLPLISYGQKSVVDSQPNNSKFGGVQIGTIPIVFVTLKAWKPRLRHVWMLV